MKLLRAAAGILAALGLAVGGFAYAQDAQPNLNVKDASATVQPTCAFNIGGGVLVPCHVEYGVDSGGVHHQVLVDSGGHILASVSGAVTISGSALPTNAAQETGGNIATIAARTPALNGDGGSPVHIVNAQFPADAPTSGTINSATPNAAFTVTLASGEANTTFAVSGLTAAAATLTLEGSADGGTTWSAITEIANGTGAKVATLTADGQFGINSGGWTKVRLRVSTTGAGTITVAANASTSSSRVTVAAPLPGGANSIGNTGTAGLNVPLLTNASSSGSAVTITAGGPYVANGAGTFSGATVTITKTINGNAITLGSWTAAFSVGFSIENGASVQATVAGGSPSGLNVTLNGGGDTGVQAVMASTVPTAVTGCDHSALYDASTSGDTQVVAAVSGQSVYICGFVLFAAGTVNLNLDSADTGGSCANPVKMTPAFQFTTQTGLVDPATFFRGLKTPASKALCVKASGATAAQILVYYTQQP